MTTVNALAELAMDRAGLSDFGPDTWQEGLQILLDELTASPSVVDSGREFVEGMYVDALWNRLRVIAYAKAHPEVPRSRRSSGRSSSSACRAPAPRWRATCWRRIRSGGRC